MIRFPITQPGFPWGKAAEDGLTQVLVKNLPKGFSPARLERALDKFVWGKAKRPMVKEAKDACFHTYKGGLGPRPMMVVTLVPHAWTIRSVRKYCPLCAFQWQRKGILQGFDFHTGLQQALLRHLSKRRPPGDCA